MVVQLLTENGMEVVAHSEICNRESAHNSNEKEDSGNSRNHRVGRIVVEDISICISSEFQIPTNRSEQIENKDDDG